ncbi:hypothetical protein HNQ77_003741 [Silvibacterium bohemicum]|uniref:Uncharacterized protein n=1 Tax=Silvibacterium bohemicum TaxID=1577686 RepID=A0A841JXA5_9BACT|nr:hypothetical protein [Silvibacterium bohemicum]MBB6145780.1 hypothetical protein [Silvibacterium bohemicum]
MRAGTEAEGIEKVLGRFQAWNSDREFKTGARESKLPKDGVREISYEEALESSRYRWKNHGNVPAATHREPAFSEPAGDGSAAADPEGPKTPPIAARPEPSLPALTHAATAHPRRTPHKPQAFRTALAHSVGAGAIGGLRAGSGEERQVSMTTRVGSSEQALIKIRAAEAGISVSAYLRQCALDVEVLRAQVQQFMAAAARSRLAELPEPSRIAMPVVNGGWFSRWQRRIWGAKTTQLSLKA